MKKIIKLGLLFFILFLPVYKLQAENDTQYEYIVIATNRDYAQTAPGWKEHAQEIIDFVNKAFSASTKIQYKIAKFELFDIDYSKRLDFQVLNLATEENLHYLNSGIGKEIPYATTIIMPVFDSSKYPDITKGFQAGLAGLTGVARQIDKNGKTYILSQVTIFQDINPVYAYSASILGAEKVAKYYPAGWKDGSGFNPFQSSCGKFIHELGHTFGLGMPEIYTFTDNIDNSGVNPKLKAYDFDKKYGLDSMGAYLTKTFFNKFDSWLINSNLRHQRDWGFLNSVSRSFSIKVVGSKGKPVPNAEIKIYGSKLDCPICSNDPSRNNLPSPLMKKVKTDKNGIVNLNKDAWVYSSNGQNYKYATLIIKASANNKNIGGYLSIYDILSKKTMTNTGNYELRLILN